MTRSLKSTDDFNALPELIRAEIAGARGWLDRVEDDPIAAVHEARKHIKKARSSARLMRPAAPETSKRVNAAGRRAGRVLSEARDGDSLELIARAALLSCKREDARAALRAEADRGRADAERADRAAAADQARLNLDEMEAELAAFEPVKKPGKALAKGLARTYTRARKALDAAEDEPDGEHMHDLRKRVKDWRYHAVALKRVWPEDVKRRKGKAERLSGLLGDHHDLTRLIERLDDRQDEGRDAALDVLTARRDALAKKALKQAKSLFSEPAGKKKAALKDAA